MMTEVELRESALVGQIEQLADKLCNLWKKCWQRPKKRIWNNLSAMASVRRRKLSGQCRTDCWRNILVSTSPSTTGTWLITTRTRHALSFG